MMIKYYFINKFDTNYIDKQDRNTAIIFRNYNFNNNDVILKLKRSCKKMVINFLYQIILNWLLT